MRRAVVNSKLYYEEITLEHLDELADLYVETFNSEPWNDEWTVDTAKKRLHEGVLGKKRYARPRDRFVCFF